MNSLFQSIETAIKKVPSEEPVSSVAIATLFSIHWDKELFEKIYKIISAEIGSNIISHEMTKNIVNIFAEAATE